MPTACGSSSTPARGRRATTARARRSWPPPPTWTTKGGRSWLRCPIREPLLTFGEAIRAGKTAGGGAESSHRAITALHLCNIAIRMGRTIQFDPVKEQIVGDEQANRLVNVPMRAIWHL